MSLDIPRPHPAWSRYGHGLPRPIPVGPCPLCKAPEPTRAVYGTDRKVCGDCIDGIPTELHVTETPA